MTGVAGEEAEGFIVVDEAVEPKRGRFGGDERIVVSRRRRFG